MLFYVWNLCVEGLFEKLQLHMIMAKKKKKKNKKPVGLCSFGL